MLLTGTVSTLPGQLILCVFRENRPGGGQTDTRPMVYFCAVVAGRRSREHGRDGAGHADAARRAAAEIPRETARTRATAASIQLRVSARWISCCLVFGCVFVKISNPYLTAERRVPEQIPVLGSQPAGYASHKPGGRLPLLSTRPTVTLLPISLLGEQRHGGCGHRRPPNPPFPPKHQFRNI